MAPSGPLSIRPPPPLRLSIVVVSGDGLLTEVLNSMMRRPDAAVVVKLPIGIIPAGSGNG